VAAKASWSSTDRQSLCALHRSAQHNNHDELDGSAQNWSGYVRVGAKPASCTAANLGEILLAIPPLGDTTQWLAAIT
jgi:hypothetical protein